MSIISEFEDRVAGLFETAPQGYVEPFSFKKLAKRATREMEDETYVIDGIDLKIHPGEYVAIVGKSGCGKSTLVRLLLGFEKPQKGAIYYDGKDMSGLDLRSLHRRWARSNSAEPILRFMPPTAIRNSPRSSQATSTRSSAKNSLSRRSPPTSSPGSLAYSSARSRRDATSSGTSRGSAACES